MKKFIAKTEIPDFVGNSHRYQTEKGEISLIRPSKGTLYMYEIYCIKGDLFDGVERFNLFREAKKRINKLLKH